MHRFPVTHIAALGLLLLSAPCHAVIYKYVDREGNVTFTDKYRPGAVRLSDGPSGPTTTVSTPRRRSRSVISSPADFPRVDAATQRQRDDVRRSLLEEERAKEVKSLDAATASLSTAGNRTASERNKLDDSIKLHRKNIEMLDKELARIR